MSDRRNSSSMTDVERSTATGSGSGIVHISQDFSVRLQTYIRSLNEVRRLQYAEKMYEILYEISLRVLFHNGRTEDVIIISPEEAWVPGAPVRDEEELDIRRLEVFPPFLADRILQRVTAIDNEYKAFKKNAATAPAASSSTFKSKQVAFPVWDDDSTWPILFRSHFAVILEVCTRDLVSGAYTKARKIGERPIRLHHLWMHVREDRGLTDLFESLNLLEPRGIHPLVEFDNYYQAQFPETLRELQALNRGAWYSHPAKVDEILQRFLQGEFAQGHPELAGYGIRPVAFLGRKQLPSYASDDYADDLELLPNAPDQYDRAYNSALFDLIDAEGREHNLLIEFRDECPLWPDSATATLHGCVIDRRTHERICSFYRDRIESDTKLICGLRTPPNRYRAHGFKEEKFKNVFGLARPVAKDGSNDYELEAIFCVAARFVASWGSVFNNYSRFSAFTAMHPLSVVKRFTLAAFQHGFAQLSSEPTFERFHMPTDILSIICEYAPIDMPFVPLDVEVRKFNASDEVTKVLKKVDYHEIAYEERIEEQKRIAYCVKPLNQHTTDSSSVSVDSQPAVHPHEYVFVGPNGRRPFNFWRMIEFPKVAFA